jgi:hypothetical protein
LMVMRRSVRSCRILEPRRSFGSTRRPSHAVAG